MSEFEGRLRRQPESSFHQKISQYLNQQGSLDDGDINEIRNWLDIQVADVLEADWSEIIDDLRSQGEFQLASAIASRLIPDLEDQVDSLLSYGRPRRGWAILVGAGGSRPEPTSIPTVQELLPRLWQKAEEINAPSLLRLKQRCEELQITNIEDLLTAIDLAQAAASTSKIALLIQDLLFPGNNARRSSQPTSVRLGGSELVDSLGESSQLLFSVLVGMMKDQKENDIHKSIAHFVRGNGDVIITTNYDVCIERALGGSGYAYELDESPQIKREESKTLLLKLHGSLSWYVCKSCDTYISASLNELDAASNAKLYPIVAMCNVCAATAQQLIVPPVGAKSADHPALLEIRQKAEEAFSLAPAIAVVGYSFNESDHYITRMIARAVRQDPQKLVVMFDRSPAPFARLQRFLAAHTRHTGFDTDNQMFFVRGHAEETLPRFMSSITSRLAKANGNSPNTETVTP